MRGLEEDDGEYPSHQTSKGHASQTLDVVMYEFERNGREDGGAAKLLALCRDGR